MKIPQRVLPTDLFLTVFLVCFFIGHGTNNGLDPTHQSSINKMPKSQILWRQFFFNLIFLILDDSCLCQVDIKLANTDRNEF